MADVLHQEVDQVHQNSAALDLQHEQSILLDYNVNLFRKLTQASLGFAFVRVAMFLIIVFFQLDFIVNDRSKDHNDSWSVIFLVVSSMMDFLSIINDITIVKYLENDQVNLNQVKAQLADKETVTAPTKIGPYTAYLSIFSIIKNYKYRNSISISQSVRGLHFTISVYIFGNLAVHSLGGLDFFRLKNIIIWLFLLSIYLNVFQLDNFMFQMCDGPYVKKTVLKFSDQNEKKQSQSSEEDSIKYRYIKSCRRPFEVFYIITMLAMMGSLVAFFKASLLNFMMILCICACMVELVHEKYLQNKLMELKLSEMPYLYLTPYKILSQLCRNSKKTSAVIRSFTRLVMVLTVLAYFRERKTPFVETVTFMAINLLFIVTQSTKFNSLQHVKIYVLSKFRSDSLSGQQCSICLLPLGQNESLTRLPCFQDHIFHYSCMNSWMHERKQCPLCRYSLEEYEIQ